jgi:alpha-tubulin suppressor-like RCC1 family protein
VLAVAEDHTCAITNGGRLECWGANDLGQLGTGDMTSRAWPTPVMVAGAPFNVFAGAHGTAVATTDGRLAFLGWGTLATTTLDASVAALSSGAAHACALRAGGLSCWGSNSDGELGTGSSSAGFFPDPAPVVGLDAGVLAVSAGSWHACAITASRGVRCWGLNDSGQVGNGKGGQSLSQERVPVDVLPLAGIVAIAAGSAHSCALTAAGAVLCWGSNDFGQLGVGGLALSTVPFPVPLGAAASAIGAGAGHTCALLRSGRVVCWGSAAYLGIDDMDMSPVFVPTEVLGLRDVVELHVSGGTSCAVVQDGGVFCWGQNAAFPLGAGLFRIDLVPVEVVFP